MNYGGLQKVVQLLAERQILAGHSVTIGCWTNQGNHPEVEAELEAAGVRIVYLLRGADGRIYHGRKFSFNRLRAYLGTGKADILHIHNPFEYTIYGALAAYVSRATRTAITIHATVMFDRPKFGRKGRAQFWLAAMLSDGVVAVCDEVRVLLRRRFILPPGKMFVVDNGIDLGSFLAVPDRKQRAEIVFGTAGRMSWEKGHAALIEAFALAHRKHDNIRLRILGGGELETELREQAHRLGLDHAVEFCGFSDDVAGFLGGLDVYVLPSHSEALPLSLIEAIASGLPVVATAVGGVPSIVQKTEGGWTCEPKSAEALLAAMELAICSRHEWTDRTRRARKLAAQLYSADRMAADYEAVYRKLLG